MLVAEGGGAALQPERVLGQNSLEKNRDGVRPRKTVPVKVVEVVTI